MTHLSGSANQLRQLYSSVKASKHATYKATYTTTTGGQTVSVVIEQAPPKSLFSTQGAVVISNGKKTYYCTNVSGRRTCVAGSGGSPLDSFTQLFSPAEVLSVFKTAQSELGAHVAGYSVKVSNSTYAGLPSRCVTLNGARQNVKYCVTKSGIVAAASSSSSGFKLVKFSRTVSGSDFSLPEGSTAVTLPGGVTISFHVRGATEGPHLSQWAHLSQ